MDGNMPAGRAASHKRFENPLPEEGDNGLYSQSWFIMCMSDELKPGQLMRKEFLGGKVVVYRDNSGVAHTVSAYCPHMGADLACGSVEGNELVCAFHKWRYGADGRCTKTGIGEPAPPNARLFVFPTQEKYGFVWAFNGETPLWELPNFRPPFDDDSKLAWKLDRRDPPYKCSPWVFTCNTLDLQHIIHLHHIKFDADLDKIHDEVRWQPFGFDYDLRGTHQGGMKLDWEVGIRGTSLFIQQGMYNGFWFGFVTGYSMPFAGQHDGYLAIAVEKLGVSPEEQALVQARLDEAMDLEIRTVEEDREILNNIRYAPGHLIKIDKSIGRFFQYLRDYPRAHPSRDFIH
jgi:nitrite reductase/ring-hydroxylating ferredoxin subunit